MEPALLSLETWADGVPAEGYIKVTNVGRVSAGLEWEVPGDLVELEEPPSVIAPGEFLIRIRAASRTPGVFIRHYEAVAGDGAGFEGTVEVRVLAVPECVPSSACVSASFDKASRACSEASLPDGQRCDPGSLCVESASCQSGRCVGKEKECGDGDECTVDVCNAGTGCEHLPAPPCPGDGVCQAGRCERNVGCVLVPREDGASCGSSKSCVLARVCIAGECVSRRPPTGFVCAEASPCEEEGRCVRDECVKSGSRRVLEPSWIFDSLPAPEMDAGVPVPQYSEFVVEASGAVTLGSFFASPVRLRANTSEAVDAAAGSARRCVVWNSRVVCADYPSNPNGRVTAIDPKTGDISWSFDIRVARPDFVAQTASIFLARLAVQGSDRLAALYEAYPAQAAGGSATLCRKYFLVVIDGQGRLVRAQAVTDPLLDVCNHPHPYGVASDVVGNVFIAFSPSRTTSAPLFPDKPMLLMSFTHEGILRWKRTEEGMTGGELAIARGLLYSENSNSVLAAATGQVAFEVGEDVGRVVVAESRLLTAPQLKEGVLKGYEAGTSILRWEHRLPAGQRFWSDQLRLAAWSTSGGARTVALSFIEQENGSESSSVRFFTAFDVMDGSEAFSCPVSILGPRTSAQLFEVARGSIALMEGAVDDTGKAGCSKCDPPFANSAGRFSSFPMRGISIAVEPWLGTFGGAGHDHQEERTVWRTEEEQ